MSQDYKPGDFLIFQIESAYGLLRLLSIEIENDKRVWHVAAYSEMFMEVENADRAVAEPQKLSISHPHLALTTRAFESTQTARLENVPLSEEELSGLKAWKANDDREVSDRSVRLLLGLR